MAQLNRHGKAGWLICLVVACSLTQGCSESDASGDVSGAPFVHVEYEGQPLANVQVFLRGSRSGPVLAQSISRQDGNAYFTQLPSPEPSKYFVTVESLGDGGWILDADACQQLTESTFLQSLTSSPVQRIELPDGAVHPIYSSSRR